MRVFVRKMSQIIPDLPEGPLDFYRKKASFDWKKLKVFLDTEEIVKYQNDVHKELQKLSIFKPNIHEGTFDDFRHKSTMQYLHYGDIDLLKMENQFEDLKRPYAALRTMFQLTPSSQIKHSVGDNLFTGVIRTMGTERHQHYADDSADAKIFGCFCLTEIGHGTNTKGMRTTATYDKKKKCFVFHSPDFAAAKCWAGGLGQVATHAVVFAQLVIDGTQYGLHTFLIPIRNPEDMVPFSGVTVGDMGEKIGLNGLDNGFLMFDNYEVSRECLLNKIADVTEEGEYVTPFRDPKKRHGASLGPLSGGRVNIAGVCEAFGSKALTIALRYAGVRKQFGPGDEEVPILEYQTHQHRLIPYLAATYVLKNFNTFFVEKFFQMQLDSIFGNNKNIGPDLGIEIHAISSGSKPLAGWLMMAAIQQCRETCGGHGYLKASGIGDIRNDCDANLTYEGENHVLIQQTSNWLLKFWPQILKREKIATPLESANFLSNGLDILNSKFSCRAEEELRRPENIMSMVQWLVVYLLKETHAKLENFPKDETSQFWAKNNIQVYYAKDLAVAFIEHYFLKKMLETINQSPDGNIKHVLERIFSLYGLWSLQKHTTVFYKGGYASGPNITDFIQNQVLKLCSELKDDAISLVDVIAPPDFILNSVLGHSNGEVYKNLQSAIFRSPHAMSRPSWWQDIVNWKYKKSKL
ncbi:unnamed protein product [Brassicogethes aeneus]|uniref:Acyl-coenzyme A oxidase n=1 Tax=Brassicogethes aeneus TaxID=1431903 RepID=A0A9P0B662_BRAAE|nr:unnamed protein product [Brassicogethes aeneus]